MHTYPTVNSLFVIASLTRPLALLFAWLLFGVLRPDPVNTVKVHLAGQLTNTFSRAGIHLVL